MTRLTLDVANTIIAACLAEGAARGLKPLSVAVLDAGGHLVAFQRADGASLLRPQIAIGKAHGALSLGVSSRKIADMAAERPSFVASLSSLAPYGIIPAAGGVLLIDGDDQPIGAVGVTGDLSDQDEACALAAIKVADLVAQS
jgi:uncharacterized protein GlcG (DUF336 family)